MKIEACGENEKIKWLLQQGQTRQAGWLDYGAGSGREKWTFEIY